MASGKRVGDVSDGGDAYDDDFSGKLDARYSGERNPLDSAKKARETEEKAVSKRSEAGQDANEAASLGESFRYTHSDKESSKQDRREAGRLGKKMLKIAPTGGIASIVIAGVVMGIFMLAPSTQINHIIETITGKYDMGGLTATRRTNKIWATKLGSKATTSTFGFATRYKGMSANTIANFNKNGFQLLGESGDIISGSATGKSSVFQIKDLETGNVYGAKDITRALEKDVALRSRVGKVYKPGIAVWFDKVATKFKQTFGLTKSNAGVKDVDTDDPDAINKQIAEQTSEKTNPAAKGDGSRPDDDDPDAGKKTAENDEHAKQLQEGIDEFNGSNGKAVATKILKGLSILSVVQSICDVLTFINILDFMVKDTQTEQLMNGFQIFGAEGDKAKAGDQKSPEVVAVLGNRLNEKTTCENPDGTVTKAKSGTEGQVYRWLAYSEEVNEPDCSASQFVTGGVSGLGPVASFVKAVAAISMDLCAITNNLFVRITTTAVGIGLSIYTMGFGQIASQAVTQFAKSQAFNYVGMFVMQMAVKIIAGKVLSPELAGQDYLNSIVIGAGALHGKAAEAGGNLALSNKKAESLYKDYQEYIAQVAEEERYSRSPFDIGSKYTFLGSIVNRFAPFIASVSSLSGIFTTFGSVVRTTFADLTPISSAASLAELRKSSAGCKDEKYKAKKNNLATDPWCNLIYGVDPKYLDEDPDAVLEYLASAGEIVATEGGGRPKILKYYFDEQVRGRTGLSLFEEQCVNRHVPLIISEEMASGQGTGENCILRDDEDGKVKSYYSLFFIDSRVEDNIDGDGMKTTSQSSANGGKTGTGCDNVKDCAARVAKLYDDGKIEAYSSSTWPKYMKEIAKTGTGQPNACGVPMTLAVPLADTLVRTTDKYSLTVGNFGFLDDLGRICDNSSKHMVGQAVDINAISDATGNMDKINWNSGQVGLITEYVTSFLEASKNTRPSKIMVGQSQCSAEFTGAIEALGFANVKLFEDSCDHLHIAVVP